MPEILNASTLRGLVEAAGVKVKTHFMRGTVPIAYDGRGTITLEQDALGASRHEARMRRAINLAHEFAHYIIATPKQRMMVNFGLGPPDWDMTTYKESPVKVRGPIFIETQACILDALLLEKYKYGKIGDRLAQTGIDEERSFNIALGRLIARGLVVSSFLRYWPVLHL